ncbi:MAG TPA: MEDS domain-containing protein [Gaiellaceae bacterium]|nr:MEDS domain-containing protein [Gaiellaceae bacterium]
MAALAHARGDLRESGIGVLGPVPWSSHFVQFYETTDDLLDVLVPYFAAGLAAGEASAWVTAPPLDPEAAAAALSPRVPDLDEHLASGAMSIVPYTEVYVPDGVFNAGNVLAGWVRRLEDALAAGFSGLRVSGDTFWLPPELWNEFSGYECQIEAAIEGRPLIVLCTYSLPRCDGRQVLDVVRTHQYALVKNEGRWQQIESSDRKRAIAEVERLNAELTLRGAELASANEELRTFAYTASHDLRAPLRAISGFAAALEEDAGAAVDGRLHPHVERIVAAAARMDELLDGLLQLSRVLDRPLETEPVDLAAVARSLLVDLERRDPARRVEATVPTSLLADGDPSLVRDLLQNLLENAWKYTAAEPVARIELGAVEDGGETVFFVRDNGVGFDPRRAPELFRPFVRLHAGYPGSGIGLATVSRIAARHGGRVWADGAVDEGATVWFTLAPAPAA